MSVRLPTGHFLVRTPGPAELDAQRNPVPGPPADRGPYPGHAAYVGGQELREGRREQVGSWAVQLDPAAWPVTADDQLVAVDAAGGDPSTVYRVHAAANLPGTSPALAYVLVDADVIEQRP